MDLYFLFEVVFGNFLLNQFTTPEQNRDPEQFFDNKLQTLNDSFTENYPKNSYRSPGCRNHVFNSILGGFIFLKKSVDLIFR